MIRSPKSVLSFGAIALAAGVLTLAVPQAAHAVAAALVQVTNTAASPAITQGVPTLAGQIVDLGNTALPNAGTVTPFYSISPAGIFDFGYSIPANQSLVVTAVDITPSSCTPTSYTGISNVAITDNGNEREAWSVSGQAATHFVYPSGIVLAAGSTPAIENPAGSPCAVLVELHGYLTSN
jgi:hypothetical protein